MSKTLFSGPLFPPDLQAQIADRYAMFAGVRMEGDGGDGSGDGGDGGSGEQTFTQAEVDKIIGRTRTEERRKAAEKYADYDDLKAKAEGAKSLEGRIADLEDKGTKAEQRALRAEIAGEYGISTKRGPKGEKSDADLFLTGADEETLRSQAERLGERESERKKRGNRVPDEGKTTPKPGADKLQEFSRGLFGRDD